MNLLFLNLQKNLTDINKSALKQTNNTIRGEGMKSTRDILKQSNGRLNSASYSPFGKSYDNTYNDEADETELVPAEELTSTDRKRMNENAENINNDSILRNFYKKKIESSRGEEFSSSFQHLHPQNQDEYKVSQNDAKDFIKFNAEKEKQNTQQSISSLISRHNQISQKVIKKDHSDTHESTHSKSKIGNPSHKRIKSYNFSGLNKPNQSIDSKYSVQNMLNKSEASFRNDNSSKRAWLNKSGVGSESFDCRDLK